MGIDKKNEMPGELEDSKKISSETIQHYKKRFVETSKPDNKSPKEDDDK